MFGDLSADAANDSTYVCDSDLSSAIILTAADAGFDAVEGTLDMRFQLLRDTSGPGGSVWSGIVTIQPVTIYYTFRGHETIHILEGEVTITVDDEIVLELSGGDSASFTSGTRSKWVVKSRLREFFVLTGP